MSQNRKIIYALPGFEERGKRLAEGLGYTPGEWSAGRFSNGERFAAVETPLSGADCFVVGSVAPPDDQLLLLLWLCGTLKKEGAQSITLLLPYLGYARQDRGEAGRSQAAALVGKFLASAGVDRVITAEAHSLRALKHFPMLTVTLPVGGLLADAILKTGAQVEMVVAPDDGARERGEAMQRQVKAEHFICMDKQRTNTGVVHAVSALPPVKTAVVCDDMLDTGGTLVSCCRQLQQAGVEQITVAVAHGLFTGDAWRELWTLGVKSIACTDSVNGSRELEQDSRIIRVPLGPIFVRHIAVWEQDRK